MFLLKFAENMEKEEYRNIYNLEDSHFYYVSLHSLVLQMINKYGNLKKGGNKILDIGCGTGGLLKKMEKYGDVLGIDNSLEALKLAKKRKVKVEAGSATNLSFPANTFTLVTLIDVLYHKLLKDDIKALQEIYRVLAPGGLLILRVAANKWMKLSHDRFVHARERYEKEELREKLKKAGFIVDRLTFMNLSLYPFAVFSHLKEKLFPGRKATSSIYKALSFINKTLIFLLSCENWLLLKFDLPFGVGLIAVCRKPRKLSISSTI